MTAGSAPSLARLQRARAQVSRGDPHGDYRFLLARLYTAEERYPQAAALYAELVDLYPEDAAMIAQSAQALYLAGGRTLTPAVQALIDRAFAIDPAQVTLLGLVGMDRFQAGDYRGAVDRKLLDHLPRAPPTPASFATASRWRARARRKRRTERRRPRAATVRHAGCGPGPRLQVAVSLRWLQLRPGDTVPVRARWRRPGCPWPWRVFPPPNCRNRWS
jgi:tetratricopeptide (TPR) repeat protein